MIQYCSGDILKSRAEALVNPVNCVGVMGEGLALQFKQASPNNFMAYAAACKHGQVKPGHMLTYVTGRILAPFYIINFPTKRHWREPSYIEDIGAGLVALETEIRLRYIRSIALPPLGCGLGGLDWETEVLPRMQGTLGTINDVRVMVYEPR